MNGGLRILGAGGHAKVAIEAWRSSGRQVISLHDDDLRTHGAARLGVAIEGDLQAALNSQNLLHIAIGNNAARSRFASAVPDDRFPVVSHAASLVSPTAFVGAGTLVCAGVVIQAEARIGRHCILNTSAVVEHDVVIDDFVHIAPGCRLAGGVRIGKRALIGIGAVLLPGVRVGDDSIVGAGAVVIGNIGAGETVVGNPARLV